MFAEIDVEDHVKRVIDDLLEKIEFKATAGIKYSKGSRVGDGYGSKTIAVEAKNDAKSLHLFLKCALNVTDTDRVQTDRIYANEIYFYKTVYPSYTKFQEERGLIEDGFRNAPEYYGARRERFNEIIILENLRSKGYTLFNRFKFMDDAHLTLVLKTFAKFHAVSFAFKDQMAPLHDEMCGNCYDVIISMEAMGFFKVLADMARDFFEKLDPIEDKDIVDRSETILEKMADCVQNSHKSGNRYSILTKGDCWSNNMMILYEVSNPPTLT